MSSAQTCLGNGRLQYYVQGERTQRSQEDQEGVARDRERGGRRGHLARRTGEGQRTSLRAVGRRGHLAREDWRGTEDAREDWRGTEKFWPGTEDFLGSWRTRKGHPEQQRTKKGLSRTPRGHLEPSVMGPSPYRLKGDIESLKKRVCEHFSSTDVENAKRVLWDYCRQELEAAGIVYLPKCVQIITKGRHNIIRR